MKNTRKMRFTAILAAVAVAASVTVYAAYDSSKDPLISLSYLNEVFKPEVKGELSTAVKTEVKTAVDSAKGEIKTAKDQIKEEIFDELRADIYAEVSADYAANIEALQKQIDVLSNEYAVVDLTKGQRLTASAACEIVLLSGSATVRCSAKDQGIIDCTDGFILYDGQNVPANHKLLVPNNGDGRGVTAAGTVQLLVKGGYTVG